jgi:nucleoside-diphosphate-sugar epimerase
VNEDVEIPVTYYKDAVRATEMVYYAPISSIKTVCYNIVGISPARTAKELLEAIKVFLPESMITFEPNKEIIDFYRSYPVKSVDDTPARDELGWVPEYTDYKLIVKDFIEEVRERPGHHGLL